MEAKIRVHSESFQPLNMRGFCDSETIKGALEGEFKPPWNIKVCLLKLHGGECHEGFPA